MCLMDILTNSSLVVGIASIVLALFSLISANNSKIRSQEKELATMSQEYVDKIIKENNTIDSNKLSM